MCAGPVKAQPGVWLSSERFQPAIHCFSRVYFSAGGKISSARESQFLDRLEMQPITAVRYLEPRRPRRGFNPRDEVVASPVAGKRRATIFARLNRSPTERPSTCVLRPPSTVLWRACCGDQRRPRRGRVSLRNKSPNKGHRLMISDTDGPLDVAR